VLEGAGIKIDSVASELLGKSGRATIEALIADERNPVVLADLAKGVLCREADELAACCITLGCVGMTSPSFSASCAANGPSRRADSETGAVKSAIMPVHSVQAPGTAGIARVLRTSGSSAPASALPLRRPGLAFRVVPTVARP